MDSMNATDALRKNTQSVQSRLNDPLAQTATRMFQTSHGRLSKSIGKDIDGVSNSINLTSTTR